MPKKIVKTKKTAPTKPLNAVKEEKIISEVHHKGDYQKIRLVRIKYEEGNATHMDLRVMQKTNTENENGEEVYVHTKQGFRLKESDFIKIIKPYLANLLDDKARRVAD